jgi:hypothetical protein
MKAASRVTIQEDEIRIGFCASEIQSERGFILTHYEEVTDYSLPFAFPGIISRFYGNDARENVALVCDYYELPPALRNAKRIPDKSGNFFTGIYNKEFSMDMGEEISFSVFLLREQNPKTLIAEIIGRCADIVLTEFYPGFKSFDNPYSANVSGYEAAAYGLKTNLKDPRAIIQDGIGTFNPYAFHEKGAYTESFAAMDVAKGLYRYALAHDDRESRDFIKTELYKLADTKKKAKWIESAHNTDGFFHFAYGDVPEHAGLGVDFISEYGKFTDFDGHEEGPNLLSTFKYYERVLIMGEMVLLENDSVIKEAFLKTVPFVNTLKMKNYVQAVTYDLDSHEAVTGKDGSGGGTAMWSIIHFLAHEISGDGYYLDEALKGIGALNKLDYFNMYSMRSAPKPIAVGWAVRANIITYRKTKNKKYLTQAKKFSKALYAHFYLSPHPYTYYPTVGFAYADARERWEAFREIVETIWLALPILEENADKNLLKVYHCARQNLLWTLPINGNPYGNMQNAYDSIGGEFVPYEFPTGHMGDNPGLEGGCQSLMRQTKEIYGSGELFLANRMFDCFASSSNRKVLVLALGETPETDGSFILYNNSDKTEKTILRFFRLKGEAFTLLEGSKIIGAYSCESLRNGLVMSLKADKVKRLRIGPYKKKIYENNNGIRETSSLIYKGNGRVDFSWRKISGATHYILTLKNDARTMAFPVIKNSFGAELDRELAHDVSLYAVKDGIRYLAAKTFVPAAERIFGYRYDFNSTDTLALTNFTVNTDLHMLMFFGVAPDKSEGCFKAPLGEKKDGADILQMRVSSLAACCTFDVNLLYGEKAVLLESGSGICGLYEYDISFVPEGERLAVEIKAKTEAGLGLSIDCLNVVKYKQTDRSAIFTDFTYTTENKKTETEFVLPYIRKYLEIFTKNIEYGNQFKFFADGKELLTKIETENPARYYRVTDGIYKFELPENTKKITAVINAEKEFIKLIKLTDDQRYQNLTNYFSEET